MHASALLLGQGEETLRATGSGQGAVLVRMDFVSPKVRSLFGNVFPMLMRLGRDSPMGGLAEVIQEDFLGEHRAKETWGEKKV